MIPLLTLALLLAGCAPAPKLTHSHTECQRQFNELHKAFNELEGAFTELLSIVRKYERMNKPPTWDAVEGEFDAAKPTPAYSISGLGWSLHTASKERPIARFHYAGGAWCNVWADDQGLHWEACK